MEASVNLGHVLGHGSLWAVSSPVCTTVHKRLIKKIEQRLITTQKNSQPSSFRGPQSFLYTDETS